jgi:N6-adenosine-specific RNA methylase IME4
MVEHRANTSLILLGQATKMLEEVRTVEDVKKLTNLAEAARIYAKQVDLGLVAQNHAAEIKIRAQRRGGELLATMEKDKGGYAGLYNTCQYEARTGIENTKPPTLKELGIDRHQSSMWQAVASVPEDKFEVFIQDTKGEQKELTTSAVVKIARQSKAQKKAEVVPLATNDKHNVIYADPPWKYEAGTINEERTIEYHYPTMSLEEIEKLGESLPVAKDAVLFLWATAPMLPAGLEVMDAWGFRYRTCAIWDKELLGLGYYFRIQHELLLVGKKGKMPVPDTSARTRSVIRQKRTKHSEKPMVVYDIIEKMYPQGSYLELFARREHPNWTAWGNEIVQKSHIGRASEHMSAAAATGRMAN